MQNSVSQKIGEYKRDGKDATDILSGMQELSREIKEIKSRTDEAYRKLNKLMLTVPNIFDKEVPVGKDEGDNKIVYEWGEKPKFNFEPLDYLELSKELDLIDFERATKIAGSGFVCYTGKGARLERSLINFMLDFHTKHFGYKEIVPPLLVNRETMTGTGQLPKLEDDMYRVDQDDLFLIPTAEVPLTNLFRDEILDENELPQKLVAYTPCFRREAGSYGRLSKGLMRVHQFNKVELVQITKPEESEKALKEILNNAEAILQELGLHYRVSLLCSGDLSFAAFKCFDIEVWAPGLGRYLEVSSCSNFLDFQARRANIRYRKNEDGKVNFVHTLNGSGLATPRTLIAIIESFQDKNKSINLPDCIKKYFS
ncbi:MAG: serine--tRNA ligase, partial [Candidatus Auribacterota bacterium]|nr:serine--tRNA ligase [Candidatus Auribacterota bacterium]